MNSQAPYTEPAEAWSVAFTHWLHANHYKPLTYFLRGNPVPVVGYYNLFCATEGVFCDLDIYGRRIRIQSICYQLADCSAANAGGILLAP